MGYINVPGTATLPNQVREWLNMPKFVSMVVAAIMIREYMKPESVRVANADECQSTYCPQNTEVWIDRAMNTLLKDQSMGAGLGMGRPVTLQLPAQKVKSDYYREQVASPGVQLVAHTVA